MKHFDADVTDDMREIRNKYIDSRLAQLQNIAVESGDQALKYLFLTNAGGAVAVLAYLGSSSNSGLSAKLTLVLFFIGILFVGFYRAYMVHYHESLFKSFSSLINQYYSESIGWAHLTETDESNVGNPIAPYIFGYISFGCFILGCIFGACSLF